MTDRKPQEVLVNELVKLRQDAGLTQREVAERMGVHLTMVQRIENRKKDERTLGTLIKYADAINAELDLHAVSAVRDVTDKPKELGVHIVGSAPTFITGQ